MVAAPSAVCRRIAFSIGFWLADGPSQHDGRQSSTALAAHRVLNAPATALMEPPDFLSSATGLWIHTGSSHTLVPVAVQYRCGTPRQPFCVLLSNFSSMPSTARDMLYLQEVGRQCLCMAGVPGRPLSLQLHAALAAASDRMVTGSCTIQMNHRKRPK